MKLIDAYRTDDPVIDRCTFVFDEIDPPGHSGNAELARMDGAGLTDDEKETLIDVAIYSPETLEREAEREREQRGLEYGRWLFERGRITDWPEGAEPGAPLPKDRAPATQQHGRWAPPKRFEKGV